MKSFLSEKQLEKLVMTIDGQDEPCLFEITFDEKNPNKQFYTTISDWDPVKFTLEFKGDDYKGYKLIIEVGNVLGIFSTTIVNQVDEEFKISKDELKLIKSLIKNYTDVVGNYVYIK